jgi:O-methyltransferase involved in polyketide biosynthesis
VEARTGRGPGGPHPPTLHYAPIDFERASLTDGLVTAGLKRHEPAFFAWLGVTQYLTREAVLRTLREVAALSTVESTLVLEFLAPLRTLEQRGRGCVQRLGRGGRQAPGTVAQLLHTRRHAGHAYSGRVQIRRMAKAIT